MSPGNVRFWVNSGHQPAAIRCLLLTQSGLWLAGQDHCAGVELQRLEICNSLRSPIHVLARLASAWLAAAVLPRALYNSASPK
jgi:hypothetical protein